LRGVDGLDARLERRETRGDSSGLGVAGSLSTEEMSSHERGKVRREKLLTLPQ
jgi:hypothetical protein